MANPVVGLMRGTQAFEPGKFSCVLAVFTRGGECSNHFKPSFAIEVFLVESTLFLLLDGGLCMLFTHYWPLDWGFNLSACRSVFGGEVAQISHPSAGFRMIEVYTPNDISA